MRLIGEPVPVGDVADRVAAARVCSGEVAEGVTGADEASIGGGGQARSSAGTVAGERRSVVAQHLVADGGIGGGMNPVPGTW